MSIKLVVFKTGEQVIADVLEWMSGPGEDSNLIGYLLKKPCIVDLVENPESSDSYKISLFPWISLTKDNNIPVPTDYVVTMVEPIDKLMEIYMRDIYDVEEESISFKPTVISPENIESND